MAPIIITFSGIDGAGKSTQIEKLRNYLLARNISVQILTFWDNVVMFSSIRSSFSKNVLQSDGNIGSPEKPAHRNDKNSQSLPLLVGRSFLHLLDVMRLRSIVRHARSSGTSNAVIFDRYIYDQLAALPLHRSWARSYARLVLSLTPQADISYVLDAIPEEARARKPEYPLEFMRKYRNSYLELRQLTPLSVISAGSPESVHASIVARFHEVCLNSSEPQPDSAAVA